MTGHVRRDARDERGQALPLVTIFFVVLLGFVGVVIDVGHAYALKRKLQASVDMGALAAAQRLPAGSGCVIGQDLTRRNYDSTASDLSGEPTCAETSAAVSMTATSDVATVFLGLFDVEAFDIGARATAGITTYVGFSNVAPWAVTQAHVAADDGRTDFHLRGRNDYGHPSLRGTISIRSGDGCGWSDGVQERRILNGDLAVCEIGVTDSEETAETFAETILDDDGNSNGHLLGLPERGARTCDPTCLAEFTEPLPDGRLRLSDDTHPNAILIPIITAWDRSDEMPVVGFVWFAITRWSGADVHGRFLVAPELMRAGVRCGGQACSEGAYVEGSPGGKIVRLTS